jgi:hypothetical protein
MELNLPIRFPVTQQSDNLFQFSTETCTYKISVYDSTSTLEGYPGAIYEISFWPDLGKGNKYDFRTANTIINFIDSLLLQDSGICICFVCDSSDNRQLARKRLFDSWFKKRNLNFIKLDAEIKGIEQTVYFHSIITSQNNPYLEHLKNIYISTVIDISK